MTETLTKVDFENLTKPDLPAMRVQAVFDPYDFHKARYLNERSSIEHRNESGQWLVDAGFIGLGGKMILTDRREAK